MELTQRSTVSAQAAGPRSRRVISAALVAILTVVAVSEAFIIGALIWDTSTHGSIDQQLGGTTAAVTSPLHAPSMAAFWAEERELAGTTAAVTSPLHAPSMAAFWAEERGLAGPR